MNSSDFLRAAGGKKIKYSFSFSIYKSRLQNLDSAPPIGRDLIEALQFDPVTKEFIKKNHLEFSLNKNFQLTIKNTTPAEMPAIEEKEKTEI